MGVDGPAATAEVLLRELPLSPDVYPQNVDFAQSAALVVRLAAGGYRAASFLDDRVLTPGMPGAWLRFDQLLQASLHAQNARPLHFIFHTGHVGSTLVTRLLEDAANVLSLREPLPLRVLAQAHDALGRVDSLLSADAFGAALGAFLRLWSRGYPATQSVVVKATSSAGRLAPSILAASQSSRAAYMSLRAEPYLAALLAGQNSPIDLRGHGPERIRRLQARTSEPLPPLHSLSAGELAAMSWLSESCTQRETADRIPGRVVMIDFDDFLNDIEKQMARVLAHFDLPHDGRTTSRLMASPALTRYSKAPEFGYTPETRAETVRDSRRVNRDEIRKGMTWLEARMQSDPSLARIAGA